MILILQNIQRMNNSQTKNLHTPFQLLLSNYLSTKKDVQGDVVDILKDIVQIKNDKANLKKDDIKNKLKQKRQILQSIKRKLSDSAKKQSQIYDICRKRLHKTKELTQQQILSKDFDKNTAMFFLQKTNLKFQEQKQTKQTKQLQIRYFNFENLWDLKNKNLQIQQDLELNFEMKKQKEAFQIQEQNGQNEQNQDRICETKYSLQQQLKLSIQFQKTLDLQDDIGLQCQLFVKFRQISESIQKNDLTQVKLFIYQNAHMINKCNSDLQFLVTICEAIQLIQKGQDDQFKALALIRSIKINKIKAVQQKKQLKKVTSMYLMQKNQININYFLTQAKNSFVKTSQQIYRLPAQNKLSYLLSIGASVLKAPCCQFEQKQDPSVCPLCCQDSHKLFKSIPILTRNESTLICRINNEVMNQTNYPIYLPNGQVYSYNGLESLVQTSERKSKQKQKRSNQDKLYYCKHTQKFFSKNECKRIFIA